jgi:hypothetical protein
MGTEISRSARNDNVGRNLVVVLRAPSAWALALVLAICCMTVSCDRAGQDLVFPKGEDRAIRKEYDKGPVRVRLFLDRAAMTVAESLRLSLEIEAREEVTVEFHALSKELGGFSIADEREDTPRLLTPGTIRYGRVYTLEPFLAGEYTIPPLRVSFHRKAPDGEAEKPQEEGQLETEAVTIEVRSVLAGKGGESPLNPIFGPIELPYEPQKLLYAFLAAAVLLVGGGAVFRWLRRKRNREAPPEPVLPAHTIAYLELQRLLDQKLPEQGLFKLFYGRVSDVLRGYLENRFALPASTLTTQEFLETIGRSSILFEPEQRNLLDAFLAHCDLVKFAELQATPEEAYKTIGACRAFIEATKQEEGEE